MKDPMSIIAVSQLISKLIIIKISQLIPKLIAVIFKTYVCVSNTNILNVLLNNILML